MTDHSPSADADADADSVAALSETVARLRDERDGLRRAMRHRAVIEQAKGALAERFGIDAETAFTRLVEMSTHNNVKVSELAAAILTRQLPQPPSGSEPAPAPPPPPPATDDAQPQLPAELGTLRSELRLLHGRISDAGSFAEIARALATATNDWPAPTSVALFRLEADGSLRLVGDAGLSSTAHSRWDRVPPIESVPVVAAVHQRTPVYLSDEAAVSRYPVVSEPPHASVMALPLLHDDGVIGVVELGWKSPLELDADTRDQLFGLAAPAAQRSAALVDAAVESDGDTTAEQLDTSMLPLFMDALSEPAVLLVPQFGDGERIIDFAVEHLSPAAIAATAAEHLTSNSASLLTVLPDVGSRLLLPALTEVLQGGQFRRLPGVYVDGDREGLSGTYRLDLHATRLWDRVLVTWHSAGPAERLYEPFLLAERAHETGVFRWELETGETGWSPGMSRLTGVEAAGPPPVEALIALIEPADRDWLVDSAADSLRGGETVSVELRGAGALQGRTIALTAEPILDEEGQLRAIQGSCRDVTEQHNKAAKARQDQVTAAAQRSRISNRDQTIDDIVAPLSAHGVDDGLTVKGLATGPRETVLRCWYDAVDLPDSSVVLIVGEVAGEQPAATVQRLRHAAIAYSVAGMAPGQLLAALNTLCCTVEVDRTAAVSVAKLYPASGELSWAASGQGAPVFLRPDRSAYIRPGALGLPVGATDNIEFQSNDTRLDAGEQMVLYTESLLNAPGTNLSRTFEALLDAAEAATPQEAYQRLVTHVPGMAESELCLLMAQNDLGLPRQWPG